MNLTMEVILVCPKCTATHILYTENIELDTSGELIFTPAPICPKCGYTGEPIITDRSMEKLDDLVFSGKIKSKK
jgi:C4-type Zn-finger protein